MNYKPYKHQQETINFYAKTPAAMDASDAGCGKTFCIIKDIEHRLNTNINSKSLIIAPKSILHSAWQDDFKKFAPHITTSVATAPNKTRIQAFQKPAQVYITNTDAVKWLLTRVEKNPNFFKDYETIVIDESIFFANSSMRTKALLKLRPYFKYARCLNGTLIGGPITNVYYQYYFLTGAQHVGSSFNKFRNMTMIAQSKPNTPQFHTWVNKPNIELAVAKLLEPITIRHVLTDVVDMPSRLEYKYSYKPNNKVMKAYNEMKSIARTELEDAKKNKKQISAVNASATVIKLLQISSGALRDTQGNPIMVDTQRFDLVVDLLLQYQNQKPLVFFNFTAQREYLMDHATKAGLHVTYIDGSVSSAERKKRVRDFEAGVYEALFMQPKATSRGLTLISSTCTIWSAPIYQGDTYLQAQARNYRIGQKNRVLTIQVQAKGTLEADVYRKLSKKVSSIELLNDALAS